MVANWTSYLFTSGTFQLYRYDQTYLMARGDLEIVKDSRPVLAQQFHSRVVSTSARVHLRVNRALRLIPQRLENSKDVSLKTLAAISGLSPSRFMHVFTESVGIPLRRYVLGLRLQRACSELKAGATVTSAACSAGFSDAAHTTRLFAGCWESHRPISSRTRVRLPPYRMIL
jgi:AraC-like DNA-binding protein